MSRPDCLFYLCFELPDDTHSTFPVEIVEDDIRTYVVNRQISSNQPNMGINSCDHSVESSSNASCTSFIGTNTNTGISHMCTKFGSLLYQAVKPFTVSLFESLPQSGKNIPERKTHWPLALRMTTKHLSNL